MPVLSQRQAELDQCMVFSMSRSDSVRKVKLGNHWGNSHALTIQWVCGGAPSDVHTCDLLHCYQAMWVNILLYTLPLYNQL
jgi:hypothetical protein